MAQAWQTFYDKRYIECLEACPGVKSPLSTDVPDATITSTETEPIQTSSPLIPDVQPDPSNTVSTAGTQATSETAKDGTGKMPRSRIALAVAVSSQLCFFI